MTAEQSSGTTTPPPRAFEVVLEHVERLILDGQLRVGDRLPPERDMAAQLGVSRPAIREAIRTLEAQGVLSSHVGSGALSGTHVISERSSALGRLLRLQVALAQFPLDEVMEARTTLERSSCVLACQQADDEGIADLRELLATMAETTEPGDYNELDTRFHVTIASLGGNSLMGDLTSAIRESLRLPILDAERKISSWPQFRDQLQADHEAIADAIADRDADRASRLMIDHIRHAFAHLPVALPSTPA